MKGLEMIDEPLNLVSVLSFRRLTRPVVVTEREGLEKEPFSFQKFQRIDDVSGTVLG